jgi:cytochrome c-type biogenesis protein CcmF
MFEGELLSVGNFGHLCTLIAFIAALVSLLAYIKSANTESMLDAASTTGTSWRAIGKSAFLIHVGATLAVFITLFYLIFNHRFEYYYVWSHSSNKLPFKYLLSCFWEGQEGSFLLWLIWHGVLGIFVIARSGKWQSPVMAVIAGVQVVLSITILGLYIGDIQFGSSPFSLLRHQMQGAPIFSQPDYLKSIVDGKGLNPLLQNYWMVIHPPILFMGFASTLIPFAYAIAGLWQRNFTEWIRPALTWGLFGVMVLGTGVIMGGAWAYESLSFGGYWAWDPVENASLVPWLTLVAGVHTLNIYKHSKYSLKTTLMFFCLTFFLIIYSTFLTRTGILGDTSVHAFTGEGSSLSYHLVAFLVLIAGVSVWMYTKGAKRIESPVTEENTWSREFWLYIGALVLLISAVQITITTSIPVWNKLFGLKLAPPADVMGHYNRIQIWIAVLIGLGTAFVQFLKYKNTDLKQSLLRQLMPVIVSVALTVAIGVFQKIDAPQAVAFLFAAVYGVVGNLAFMRHLQWRSITKLGSSTAHIGFALMLLGILLSSFNKHVISFNRLGVDFGLPGKTEEEKNDENGNNILLYRNTPSKMGEYILTYKGDSTDDPNHWYKIRYQRIDTATQKVLEEFTLYPNAQVNPKMGLVSSPGTKHYWNKDIFTYITKAQDQSGLVDTVSYTKATAKVGDTMFFGSGYMVFNGLDKQVNPAALGFKSSDVGVAAKLSLYGLEGKIAEASPTLVIANGTTMVPVEDTVENANLYVRISNVNTQSKDAIEMDFEYKQPSAANDYVVMKALVFPHINVLAIGTVVMALGTLLALLSRLKGKNL